jgi:cytochrome c biogenesis protein CcdA
LTIALIYTFFGLPVIGVLQLLKETAALLKYLGGQLMTAQYYVSPLS